MCRGIIRRPRVLRTRPEMVWHAFVLVVRWQCSTWQKPGKRHRTKKNKKRQLCRFDLCVSFPSPKHDSDRSSGTRSRVLLHSAASSFRVACQTPKKGRSLRCVVEWSYCEDSKICKRVTATTQISEQSQKQTCICGCVYTRSYFCTLFMATVRLMLDIASL